MTKTKNGDLNVSQLCRDVLASNREATMADVIDRIHETSPRHRVNKSSLSVAFYTTRQKLGIVAVGSRRRRLRSHARAGAVRRVSAGAIDLSIMQSAAKLIREAGGVDESIAAIKLVHSVQLN